MRRSNIMFAFALVTILSAVILPFTLYSQEKKRLKDFRSLPDYTVEDLSAALDEPRFRGSPIGASSGQPPAAAERPAVAMPVNFGFNSDKIRQEDYPHLDKLGKALTLPQLAESRFRIEGHTDSIGSDKYNLALSDRRAKSVMRYLVQRHSVSPQRLIVKGYGKNQPIASNDTDEGRLQNRRVEIVNLGK